MVVVQQNPPKPLTHDKHCDNSRPIPLLDSLATTTNQPPRVTASKGAKRFKFSPIFFKLAGGRTPAWKRKGWKSGSEGKQSLCVWRRARRQEIALTDRAGFRGTMRAV